ncbi:MAG: sensor histidine kinase, partial [Verrucomicrobiota bacterium]|nr:sensor histidine kinase [Verrucomicrobiota bacterium]
LNLCILRDISDRRKLEKEIQEISEKEQRRLGQDLHDGIGQMLTGINFLAKVLQQKLAAKNIEESKDAANISSLINQTLSQTRQLARGLCPVVLENNDVHAALQQLSDNLEKVFGITSHLICDPQIKIHDNAVAVHLYRVAQEATTNAMKHGKAKNIDISLTQSEGRIILRIKDNGAGISAKNGAAKKGMGLRVMHHRARMMNATLEIKRRKEGGTLVTCLLANGSTNKDHGKNISLPAPASIEKKTDGKKESIGVKSGNY